MSDISKYERYARRIALFKGLTADEVRDIMHRGKVVDFLKGQTIFHQGQLGSNLFIVLSGRVGIYHEDHMIATCRVGDAFGEMSVLNHDPHIASAMAANDVRLFTLDESQLNEVLHQHVAVRLLLNVIHILSGHLTGANKYVAMLDREVRELRTQLEKEGGSSEK